MVSNDVLLLVGINKIILLKKLKNKNDKKSLITKLIHEISLRSINDKKNSLGAKLTFER